jgi:putative effector of murein hydrolase LrgA (UPF0299 family)
MIRALALLFLCQLAGEAAVRASGLPVPGPVVGLALLAAGFMAASRFGGPSSGEIEQTELGKTASGLLGFLGILFVPAGVGVIDHLHLLRDHGVALLAALAGSTALTLIVTVWVFVLVSKWTAKTREP